MRVLSSDAGHGRADFGQLAVSAWQGYSEIGIQNDGNGLLSGGFSGSGGTTQTITPGLLGFTNDDAFFNY